MRTLTLSAIAVTIVAACKDNVGEDACIEPGTFYTYVLGGDTALVFRWPSSRQPVRVWAEPVGELQQNVQRGVGLWTGALRCDELTATTVADSFNADLIIRNPLSSPPPSPEPGSITLAADSVGACGGVTQALFDSTLTMTGPLRLFVYPLGTDSTAIAGCYRMVVTHELGHAFGVLSHSPDAGDVMFAVPRRSTLSQRDRVTFQFLHHTTPSIHPAP